MGIAYQAVRAAQRQGDKQKALAKKAPAKKKPETGVVLSMPTSQQIAIINGMDLATGKPLDASRDEINGALMLDRIVQMLSTYARLPKPQDYIVTALTIAGTHFADKEGTLVFGTYPTWMAIAPMESGKSRLLSLADGMVRNGTGPLDGAEVTSPAVRNMLDAKQTVIFDEFHLAVGTSGRRNGPMKSVLLHYQNNGGGAATGRNGTESFNTFGPKFLGAQPSIMTGTKDELLDMFSRCIIVFPEYTEDPIPDLDNMYRARAKFMNYALGRWAATQRPKQGDWLDPVGPVPARLKSRKRELARPLLAVADRAEDLRHPEGTADRHRWSIMARNALQEKLLGEGSPEEVYEQGEELFGEMDDSALVALKEMM